MHAKEKLLSSLRVLYIEDDIMARDEIAFFLEGMISELYLGSDGKEGLELYHTHAPDLIITDIQMPRMNGIDMIKIIRQNDRTTPIIITSAYNETSYLLNAINIGVDRYILKPINFEMLSEAILEVTLHHTGEHLCVTVDGGGFIVEATQSFLELFRCSSPQIGQTHIKECLTPDSHNTFDDYLSAIKRGTPPGKQIVHFKQHDNTSIEAILYSGTFEYSGNDTLCHIEIKTLDAYIEEEESLKKSLDEERFLRTLIKTHSMVYKGMATIRDSNRFLQYTAEQFQEGSHTVHTFFSALDEEGRFSIIAHSSDPRDICQILTGEQDHSGSYTCPFMEVLHEHKTIIIENLETFRDFPMKSALLEQGIASMVLLPIVITDPITSSDSVKAFNLLFADTYHIANEMVKLFENIADSITLGLKSIGDRTEKALLQQQLRRERDFMASILDTAATVITVIDRDGSIVRMNRSAETYTGYSLHEVYKQPFFWLRFLLPEERDDAENIFQKAITDKLVTRYENHWRNRIGEKRLIEWSNSLIFDKDGNVEYVVSVGNDITERKENEKLIERLAFYDPLTHLPNRRLLDNHLDKAIASSKRSGRYGAVMFLDLDNFKQLNDTYGHRMGDLLLIETAKRILRCVREDDTVARFGGDEFVILLRELHEDKNLSIEAAQTVAEKIRSAIDEPYHLSTISQAGTPEAIEHRCTSSIGIAMFCKNDISEDSIILHADIAMYDAKLKGRNRLSFFTPPQTYSHMTSANE